MLPHWIHKRLKEKGKKNYRNLINTIPKKNISLKKKKEQTIQNAYIESSRQIDGPYEGFISIVVLLPVYTASKHQCI